MRWSKLLLCVASAVSLGDCCSVLDALTFKLMFMSLLLQTSCIPLGHYQRNCEVRVSAILLTASGVAACSIEACTP